MMSLFTKGKTVIEINQGSLLVGSVATLPVLKLRSVNRFDWEKENLGRVLSQVKKKSPDKVRILLGEDFVYVMALSVKKEKAVNLREIVRKEVSKFIPEMIEDAAWDYKVVGKTGSKFVVQAFATPVSFYKILKKATVSSGLLVEAIEPVSYALARSLLKVTDSVNLILYGQEKNTAVVAGKGVVIASMSLGESLNLARVKELLDYSENIYQIKPAKIYLSGKLYHSDLETIDIEHYQVERKQLSPMENVAAEMSLKGKDEDVLNLELLRVD